MQIRWVLSSESERNAKFVANWIELIDQWIFLQQLCSIREYRIVNESEVIMGYIIIIALVSQNLFVSIIIRNAENCD